MHVKLKQQSKTGLCCRCGHTAEWKALKECSKCKLAEYCSKECQVALGPCIKMIAKYI